MKIPLHTVSTPLLAVVLCVTLAGAQSNRKKSDDKGATPALKGAFFTGEYRNLFLEAGHTQPEIDRKIDAAFQQLFHGEKENQTVYYEAGQNENGPLAY
jgi:oligosaccharide reducing-end xylanase